MSTQSVFVSTIVSAIQNAIKNLNRIGFKLNQCGQKI